MEYKNRLKGARSKATGEHFEIGLDNIFRIVRELNIAHIQKTPEPMRVVSRTNRPGVFAATFTKAAQPDYQGTLYGGRSVVLEAKFTDSDRITADRISDMQEAELNRHESMGAIAAVLVCFSYDTYGLIPWADWKNLKALLRRKYVKADDLELHGWKLNYQAGNARTLAKNLCDALTRLNTERGL